jgi:PAS domain S-box-containing protein
MSDRKQTVESGHTSYFWIAVAILAVVSSVALLSTYNLLAVVSDAARTQQTALELDEFLSQLKDVETGARGYALTHDDRFLEPYRTGSANAKARLRQLELRAQEEPALRREIPQFRQLSERRIDLARRTVEAAAKGVNGRPMSELALAGKQAMDELRRNVALTSQKLQTSYELRRRYVQRETVIASASLAAGVAASVFLLIWLFRLRNREIGRRRQAEEELRSLNLELEDRIQERTADVKRARDLLDAVVENLPDIILLKEAEGAGYRYRLINSAAEKAFGRDRSAIIGKTECDIFPPKEAAAVIKSNNAVAASGEPRTFTDRKLTTAAGVRTVETRMVPILNGSTLILAIVRDVTEAKMREDQLRQMQRLESVGGLTGGLAHDFNNLLAVILGNVELIREKAKERSETAELADEALDAAHRGADLVRRLLAFARKQHLEPTAVDLNDRLPNVMPLLERTLGENVRLQVKMAESLWKARIDATQVDDALVNLAINARDAIRDGGTLTVETGNIILDEDYASHHVEVTPGEYVMLAVSDTGTGMTPAVVARAFEPFFTTKPEGKGTGLGLSQVYGWVKQSGGHIKIYSEVGHGTTVKLYLPRAADKPSGASRRTVQKPELRGHEKILLVEDNPSVRRTVTRQLADLGYSVIEAEHGDSALRQINSGTEFDLLLTDIVMPGGLSGYQLADEATKLRPDMRVLFTSGYTELAAAGIPTSRSGPLLSKPYSKNDLGRAVRSALDRELST